MQLTRWAAAVALTGLLAAPARAISYTGGVYAQDFDALAQGGTNALPWANDSTLPGWGLYVQPAPGTAATTYFAGDGSDSTEGFYSFGPAESSDRALGGLVAGGAYFGNPTVGTAAGWIAVSFTNDTSENLGKAIISYDGEQWRDGGSTAAQELTFQFGIGPTFQSVSGWVTTGGDFDWSSPVTNTAAASVNGNLAGRVDDRGGELLDLSWFPGTTLWLRWVDRNDAGDDHGLAIDNFTFTANSGLLVFEDADFDASGDVDGTDLLIWQRGLGTGATLDEGDADFSGVVDAVDLDVWRNQYGPFVGPEIGAVPEPATASLAGAVLAALLAGARRRVGR